MNYSNWSSIINGLSTNYTWRVNTAEELGSKLVSQQIKQRYNNSAQATQFMYSPLYKTIGKAVGESNSNTSAENVVVNVKMSASQTVLGQGNVDVNVKLGRSTDINGTELKTGAIFYPIYVIIASVAAACGYSIGWDVAKNVEEYIYQNTQSSGKYDFGSSAIEMNDGSVMILTIGEPITGGIKTYVEHNLLERLIIQMKLMGIFSDHPTPDPLTPVIGTSTTYNFTGRFPDIPERFVERTQKLIDTFNLDLNNQYIMWGCAADENIILTVFESNTLNVKERNSKYNQNDVPFSSGELGVRIGGSIGLKMSQYEIDASGNCKILLNNHEAWPRDFTLYSNSTVAIGYDNFGTSYRELIDDGSSYRIGSSTDALHSVVVDPNAVDITQQSISIQLPSWWADRIRVSTPDTKQQFRDLLISTDLNETQEYLPLDIVERSIDPNVSQSNAIQGTHTPSDLLDDGINKTPDVAPRIGADPYPVPDDTPHDTPDTPVLPDGITSFIDLYRISEANLATFSTWLWTPSLIENMSKLLQNPMDAIIGLHAIYSSPSVLAAARNIIVGNLVCNTTTADVIRQYNELNCGTIYIRPYFKNINDYVATKIQVYLPFIGFVDVNTSDVMKRYMTIKYNIDFLTGTCTAFIQVRDSLLDTAFTAYTFTGNCAVELPVTGANYANILRNCISAASVGATSIGTAINTVATAQVPVQRSGSCGANAGAMCIRKPYVIITRNVSVDADNRKHFEGLPQNMNVKLGAMSGYTRVKYINLDGLPCTEDEKADILSKLQGGVII